MDVERLDRAIGAGHVDHVVVRKRLLGLRAERGRGEQRPADEIHVTDHADAKQRPRLVHHITGAGPQERRQVLADRQPRNGRRDVLDLV